MTLLLTDLNVCQRKLRNFFNQLEQSNDQSSPIKEQQRNYCVHNLSLMLLHQSKHNVSKIYQFDFNSPTKKYTNTNK